MQSVDHAFGPGQVECFGVKGMLADGVGTVRADQLEKAGKSPVHVWVGRPPSWEPARAHQGSSR
jgi:hypothetical protein